MTRTEMYEKADKLETEARELRQQASALREAELKAKKVAERIIYAAFSRCPCGAGLAYDPVGERNWDCSAILSGVADNTVKHTAVLPFAFYEVKSEGQASANGATTRPK